jgi:hypothetical protein
LLCCIYGTALQGVFIPAQVAAAAALLARNSNLSAVLCQFFREDLLAWTSRKGKGSSGGVHLPSDTLKGLVVKNTQQVRFSLYVRTRVCACGSQGSGRLASRICLLMVGKSMQHASNKRMPLCCRIGC